MNRKVAVRAIVFLDGKLLCAKLKEYAGALNGDYWCVPGGGVEPGEALVPALIREMIEETAVKPVIGQLLYLQQFGNAENEHLEFFFHIENAEDFLALDLSQASHAALEIEQMEFIDPATSVILPEFLTKEDIGAAIQNKGGPKIFNYFQ